MTASLQGGGGAGVVTARGAGMAVRGERWNGGWVANETGQGGGAKWQMWEA